MNILKTVAIGMFALTATAANASTFDQIKNASFELYANDRPFCSGQFVTPTEFLTAAHCIDHAPKDAVFSIKTEKAGEESTFILDIKNKNSKLDVATFTLNDKQAAFSYVDVALPADVEIQTGQKVAVAGFPDVNEEFLFQFGTMSGKRTEMVGFPDNGNSPHYLIDVNTAPGNSGSGAYILVDGTWKLIGTLTGGPKYLWVSYFSTVESVNAVL